MNTSEKAVNPRETGRVCVIKDETINSEIFLGQKSAAESPGSFLGSEAAAGNSAANKIGA